MSAGGVIATDDIPDHWIRELRERLERGEFAGHPPIDLGGGTGVMPAYLTIRLTLDDLDHLDELATEAQVVPDHAIQRQCLLDDFRRLRELIG